MCLLIGHSLSSFLATCLTTMSLNLPHPNSDFHIYTIPAIYALMQHAVLINYFKQYNYTKWMFDVHFDVLDPNEYLNFLDVHFCKDDFLFSTVLVVSGMGKVDTPSNMFYLWP